MVTDAGLVEIGLVDRVTEALAAAGVEWSVYAEVEPDPTFAQVEGGSIATRPTAATPWWPFGGGSPMDAAR